MWRVITAFFLLNMLFISSVGADWKKAELVVKGKWGQKPGQLGIEQHDSGEDIPMGYCVTGTGFIVIGDYINTRIQVYSPDGRLFSYFKAKNLSQQEVMDRWPINLNCSIDSIVSSSEHNKQVYDLKGNLKYEWKDITGGIQKFLEDGSFITIFDETYSKYSPSGKFISKYEGIPAEIGEMLSEDHQKNGIKSTVKVNGTVYSYLTESYVQKYSVDGIGNINVLSYSGNDRDRYRFSKFDKCGKLVASLDLPGGLGEPMITIKGDIYAGTAEEDYRIFRWKWQGAPNIHSGPPPPTRTRTKSKDNRILISWDASPQDPGCITGYEISRKDSPDGIFTLIKKEPNGVFQIRDEAVVPGRIYIYKVRASSGDLTSDYSNEVEGKALVPRPAIVQ